MCLIFSLYLSTTTCKVAKLLYPSILLTWMWWTSCTYSTFMMCLLILSISIPSGVFSRNIFITALRFLIALYRMNIATHIDRIGSIIVISVNFMSIDHTKTITHHKTSSNMWRLTDFWFNEFHSLVTQLAMKFTATPNIAKIIIQL